MNPNYEEAKKSFIDERLAILEFDSGIALESEDVLMKEAERIWECYRRQYKVFQNEQVKI
jgi:hypothetical protein